MELARNPDLQARLREERDAFEGTNSGAAPTYDDYLTKLPLLDAVCRETYVKVRLH